MIETIDSLKSQYDRLVADIDFDHIELGLRNPNIFDILSISRSEIRHSNFLAWLFDPRGNHGLGDIVLRRFLREAFSADAAAELDQVEAKKWRG